MPSTAVEELARAEGARFKTRDAEEEIARRRVNGTKKMPFKRVPGPHVTAVTAGEKGWLLGLFSSARHFPRRPGEPRAS